MAVLVSNSGTQNRDFTVLIWVPEPFNGLEPPSHRQNIQVKVARVKGGRYRCVLEGGNNFYLGLIGVGSSTEPCRNA